jgi:hypothetical protein
MSLPICFLYGRPQCTGTVCPLVGIGTLPPLLSPASVPLPPNQRGGQWAHSPAGEGLGESQFRRLEKKLSTLPTLWTHLTSQGPGRRKRPERSCPALYYCPLVLLWTRILATWTRIWVTWTRPGQVWSCHSSLRRGSAGWPLLL